MKQQNALGEQGLTDVTRSLCFFDATIGMKYLFKMEIVLTLILTLWYATSFAAPIHDAAKNGNLQAIKQLLADGVDVNADGDDGEKALMWAARNGHIDIVKILLEKKAYFGIKNKNGETPLLAAIKNGHTDIVKLLIKKGSVFDGKDDQFKMAQKLAAENGHKKVVNLLLNIVETSIPDMLKAESKKAFADGNDYYIWQDDDSKPDISGGIIRIHASYARSPTSTNQMARLVSRGGGFYTTSASQKLGDVGGNTWVLAAPNANITGGTGTIQVFIADSIKSEKEDKIVSNVISVRIPTPN